MNRLLDLIEEHNWAKWAVGFVLVVVALSPFGFTGPTQSVFGSDAPAVAAWFTISLVAAALLANVWLIGLLPFRQQVVVAWAELITLFLVFFWSFDLSYSYIWARLPFLLGFGLQNGFFMGAVLTLFICFVSIAASTVLALFASLGRLSNNGLAYGLSTFYTSFFRGTPLLLQILLVYLGLPQIGLVISPIPSAVIALSLCYGAYSAEIFRAGIMGVGLGQREAARALGLRDGTIMRLIVLPQAMRLIVPPLGNQFIAMLKDSSLVSILGAWELMYMARTHGRAEFKYIEMLIAAAMIYWAMSMTFETTQARIEAYFGKSERR
ncbi:MAG TPA: amino acid ABC transporter permease [Aestuariivirgaceae bacterium]|nr:amino acid ABC transporter permease [Aestuariivirgaceae bacterium]